MKRAPLFIALAVVATALSACRTDRVDLTYRYVPGSTITYRMTVTGQARTHLQGQRATEGSFSVKYRVTERVKSEKDGRAAVQVEMKTVDFEENGLPAPGATSFSLRLGPKGEKLEVLEVDGVPAADYDAQRQVFVSTYRPLLPLQPIRLHGAWNSSQGFDLGNVKTVEEIFSELTILGEDEEGEFAEIEWKSEGPFRATTELPQGTAQLRGSQRASGRAELGLGNGLLREGSSETVDRFRVRISPEGGEGPRTGTLSQRHTTELELLSIERG